MGFLGFKKAEKINASKLSDRVRPIYEQAYGVCREFGREEGQYFNYRYKDQNIDIRHYNEGGSEVDAFSLGKCVHIEYKGYCVFDCKIKLNGVIKLKVSDGGEWKKYLSSLEFTRKATLTARDRLEVYYKSRDVFYTAARDKKIGNVDWRGYTFNDGRFQITYELEGSYTFSDGVISINFIRNEKKNISSAAIIKFNGKVVFEATHYFPDRQRPYSSHTYCKVFESGEWDKYLLNAFDIFKKTYGIN